MVANTKPPEGLSVDGLKGDVGGHAIGIQYMKFPSVSFELLLAPLLAPLLALLLALLLISSCSGERVRFADGTHTQSDHWQDRWLVINYWAEWCGPCRAEIPELNELHASRVSHGLVVLGVNWDGFSGEKLQGMIQRMEIKFPVMLDDPYQKYGYERAQQLPVTVLINPKREVSQVLVGPQTVGSILANIE